MARAFARAGWTLFGLVRAGLVRAGRAASGAVRRFQALLLALVLGLVFWAFARRLNGHLPFDQWLAFHYLAYWLLAAFGILGSGSFGVWLVRAVGGRSFTFSERLVLGSAVGVAVFGIGWAGLGFLGLIGRTTFWAWPLFLSLSVLPGGRARLRRTRSYFRRVARLQHGLSSAEGLFFLLGVSGLVLAYLPNLTPQNVAFDARWYHLPLAERYAVDGAITRHPEGWFLAGYPHLASILYSWCFSAPFETTFDRVELCLHFEFALFLLTLASMGVLARRVAPRGVKLPRFGAAMLFLFPEFFLYDSSLNGAADHVAAFWAVPLLLGVGRVYRRFDRGALAVLAIVVSAVLLTKYTVWGLLVGPALLLFVRLVWLLFSKLRKREPVGALLANVFGTLLAIFILTTPWWLKNAVFYGNPVFPLLGEQFPTRPWISNAAVRFETMTGAQWKPTRDWQGVWETLQQPVMFSFVPRDWPTFHRDWPMFGSLFTLLTPVLLFKRSRALVGLVVTANLGVMFWFWTYHQDRYLQAYLPWMAVAVWVLATAAASLGVLPRLATVLLVGLQWIWGADAPFFGSHAMVGQPLKATVDHLAGGFNGRRLEERLVAYGDMEAVRRALPEGSRVLRHENQVHTGLGHASVTDWFQSGIAWTNAPSPAGVQKTLRELGVTHVLWQPATARGFDSVGSDVVFFDYVTRFLKKPRRIGGLSLAPLAEGPLPEAELTVLYVGCDRSYGPGVYGAGQLRHLPYSPAEPAPKPRARAGSKQRLENALETVDAVVWGERCHKLPSSPSTHGFVTAARRGDDTIFVRRAER